MGSFGKIFLLYTSLSERTAQNAHSFKLSDRFERCANSFSWTIRLSHSFSFAQKIKDHSSLLSVCSSHESDVPSSEQTTTVKRPKFDILFGENIFFLQNLFRWPPLNFFGGVSKIQIYGKMKWKIRFSHCIPQKKTFLQMSNLGLQYCALLRHIEGQQLLNSFLMTLCPKYDTFYTLG